MKSIEKWEGPQSLNSLRHHWQSIPKTEAAWAQCKREHERALQRARNYLGALKLLFAELKSTYWQSYKRYPKDVQELHDILDYIISRAEKEEEHDAETNRSDGAR